MTDEEQMRKALLISYRFPPQSGGGVQRTLKFTKYLREFGWEPVVQTARNPYWPLRDESLLEDVPPGVRVYRTPSFEFERLEQRLAGMTGKDQKRSRPAGEGGGAAGAGRTRGESRGGVLNAVIHELEVECDAASIPGEIHIPLDGLEIGDSIHISQVKLPDGVTPWNDEEDFTVDTIVAPSAMKAEEEEAAAEGEVPTVGEDEAEGEGEAGAGAGAGAGGGEEA